MNNKIAYKILFLGKTRPEDIPEKFGDVLNLFIFRLIGEVLWKDLLEQYFSSRRNLDYRTAQIDPPIRFRGGCHTEK